jgi:hypothetical protein
VDLNTQNFDSILQKVKNKMGSGIELNEEELRILLIAHLMEEERNELNTIKS